MLVATSLPLALDGVDLRIEARERVGICGRTGTLCSLQVALAVTASCSCTAILDANGIGSCLLEQEAERVP